MDATNLIVCRVCGESKESVGFHRNRSSKTGRASACKECTAIRTRRYYEDNADEVRERRRSHYRQNKDNPEFMAKKLADVRKWKNENKDKVAEGHRKYRESKKDDPAYREREAAAGRAWYEKNRDRSIARCREYRANNREAGRAYSREYWKNNRAAFTAYQRNRARADPFFRLCKNLRTRQRKTLKTRAKPGSAVEALGCSAEVAISHIEAQFEPGMTWANWGKKSGQWSLDHILPLASALTPDGVDTERWCVVSHYTNLRPMWHEDNQRKSDLLPDGSRARLRCRRQKNEGTV